MLDWTGDCVLTAIAGTALIAAAFLPWANTTGEGLMNLSLAQGEGIRKNLETQWGLPALLTGVFVVAAGLVMVQLGPRVITLALGALTCLAGCIAAGNAVSAIDGMFPFYRAGLGVIATLVTGALLVPIGFASFAVGLRLTLDGRKRAAASSRPAP